MVRKYRPLSVTKETHELIMNQCKKEYLDNHTELKGMNITQEHMCRLLAEFYLNH